MPRLLVLGDVIDDIVATPAGPIRTDADVDATIRIRPGGSAAGSGTGVVESDMDPP